MRTPTIVIVPPRIDDLARFRQTREYVLIKTFVAQLAVEAFDEGILHWFAWLDVVPRQPIGGPLEYGNTSQFCAIIADDHQRRSALPGEPVQLAHYSNPTERGVNYSCQALPAEVIYDA